MDSHNEQCISDFEALISQWAGAYPCASVSYVGFRTDQGPQLLFGRIVLEPTRSGVNDTSFQIETEHVIAARFIANVTPSYITEMLIKAKRGEIQTIDDTGRLLLKQNGRLSAWFSPIYPPFISVGPRIPTLKVTGANRHDLTRKLADQRTCDWELKAAESPFDNLDELLSHCNLPTQMQMGDLTALEVIVKSPAMISDSSTITNGDAVIECHVAAGVDVEKLRLGYKVLHKESAERKSVGGSALDWRQDGDVKIGIYRMPVADASVLQAFISYVGISHHQWWVSDPRKHLNHRLAIHQVFDEDLDVLRGMLLNPDTDKPYVFENALSTLLSLLGFSVTSYGRIPKLQKGPDIIAISPTGHVGVIECTVGLLDQNDKLAKLVQRTKLIRDRLKEAAYGFLQVQSVIVTPLSRGEVTANLETAGKHKIAVVCGDNIEDMLKQLVVPPNADRLFEEAKRLVPNAEPHVQ